MRSVSLNHLPQDNKNHILFIHTTISREGGVLNVTGPSIQLIYTTCQSNSSKFSLATSSILLILATQVIQKLESINLNILDPPTQPTINGHIINHFHQINQTSPYLTMLKVPPITSSLIIHTELNQEVDMQRYIFLITYDVLVSGKMAGYYMMSMMVTCITCFNDIL